MNQMMNSSNATSPINSSNPSTRYRDHHQLNFGTSAVVGMHPATTKNQNNRNFNIKKQLATSGQGVGQRNSNAGNMNNGMNMQN